MTTLLTLFSYITNFLSSVIGNDVLFATFIIGAVMTFILVNKGGIQLTLVIMLPLVLLLTGVGMVGNIAPILPKFALMGIVFVVAFLLMVFLSKWFK